MKSWIIQRTYVVLTATILLLPGYSFGKTRAQVIDDAEVYAATTWTVRIANLLDVKTYIDNGTPVPDIVENSTDGVDDRAQQYYSSTDRKTYYNMSGNRTWWPFLVGDTPAGEAYAWGYGHHLNPALKSAEATYSYKSFSEYLADGRIAGARQGELDPDGNAIGDYGNDNYFAGLDCSGFVVRAWGTKYYHLGTGQLPDYAVSVATANIKAGDIFNRVGKHTILIQEIYQSSAVVIQAVPNSFASGQKTQRVIQETIQISAAPNNIVRLWDETYENWFDYKPLSGFPQFTWSTPTKVDTDTVPAPVFDPLTQAIELTIKSGNLAKVKVSSITLVFDEGEPGEETIQSNEDGFTFTPETDDSSILVHYALPADYVLGEGIHTVKVKAANILNLEDNDSLEFYVPSSTALPRISWMDSSAAPALPTYGIFSGSNTLETASWFHSSAVRLQFDSDLASLTDFKIYDDETMEHIAYAKTFVAGTKTAAIGDALAGFTDKTGYYAVLTDRLGNATTMYFHLDKTGPVIESTATTRLSADGSGFYFDVAGQTYDGLSGINGEVALLPGDHGPDPIYAGPSYPPGPSTKTFTFGGIAESKQLTVFDRSGWIGTYDLLVEQSTDTLSVKTSTGITGGVSGPYNVTGGPSGVILNNAYLNLSGRVLPELPPGVVLLDQPVGMKLELWAEAEDLPAEYMPNLPVVYGFSPVSSQKLVEASGAGDYPSAITNLPMRHVARLKLVATPNTNSVRYTYACDTNGDGIENERCESIFAPGAFVLEGTGEASAAYASIYALRHFYQWLPSGPNQSVQAGNVNVEIQNITTGGNITVETARRTLKLPAYKMAESDVVYEIKTTAIFDGPIRLKLGGTCAFNYTVKQSTNPLILHCSADGATCAPVFTQYENCTALATVSSLSPFAAMIPLDDVTAPQTDLEMFGESRESAGLLWITTDTYVDLTAVDRATVGDISGVATTYYLVDVAPTPGCLTTAYDPDAAYGTCANSIYDGAYTLAEGSHTVNYLSVDTWGNFEQPKTRTVYVDGTAPTVEILVGTVPVASGGMAYLSVGDSVTVFAQDPESGGVASGLENTYALVDASPEECDSDAPPPACAVAEYTGPFTLSGGTHTVYYSAVDNAGNQAPVKMAQLIISGAPDTTPPVTALFIDNVVVSSDAVKYVREGSTLTLAAVDPVVAGAARSGVVLTTYTVAMLIDQNWVHVESDTYTEPMVMKGEGSYKFYYQSVDAAGNWEALNNRIINIDKTAPVAGVQVNGSSTTDAQGNLVVSADHYVSIVSSDPVSNGVASGIKVNYFTVDVNAASCEEEPTFTGPEGTCQNPRFTTPFTLAVGTHTVYYTAVDNVGNMAEIKNLFLTVSAPTQTMLPVSPASGPIGMPFTITGADFGTYLAGVTTVLVGGASAPLTLWSTSTIKGTIPGTLSAGEQTVAVMRGTSTIANAAPFTVTAPALYALTPSSGAIGLPFTITGESFGNYAANYTKVLMGGATMPLTLWTDTKIQGTIPGGLAVGDYALVVERALNGGVVRTSSATFTLSNMQAFWLAPSSGPIGMPFTITGEGFGNYSSAYEHVLLGDTTAPLTLWTDTKIQGTVPGSLTSGQYPVVVERRTADGGLMQTSSSMTFEVVTVDVASMTPVAGPIGLPFTIYGSNFGNYVANFTKVLIGGTTAPLTLWTATKIQGTIPGALADGVYPVVVERELNGGVITSSTLTFEVLGVSVASMTPVAGPIGMPFTIYGGNFGNYAAGYTKVLIGGTTVPLTLWTDTKIQGTIPGGLTDGDYPVLVERDLNGGQVQSSTLTWTLNSPELASVSPSSGPIGLPFTINGANFGNYVANYTKVLIGGATAPLSLWTDTKVQGTIPGSLAAGDYELVVVRALNGGEVRTSTAAFAVTTPVLAAIDPSTAAVIAPFTITGASFGNYVANYTKVLINGTTAPLTLWTDTKIQGKLPFLLNGTYPVQVQRSLNGGLAETTTAYITVAEPVISSMTPTSGAVGTVFNLYGSSFGPYDASQTRVTIGGVACALSLWTDTNIRGTVPTAISYGTYTVVAMRGQALSNELEYTVPEPFRVSMVRPVTMLDAEFKLGEVYVYPNPAKGGKVPVFHVEVGLADTVKIRVFSVSGQSIHDVTLTGVPQAVDGKYAYEYAWEGRIASGVYFYTMEAERAGKKLKAKGRFAVVR